MGGLFISHPSGFLKQFNNILSHLLHTTSVSTLIIEVFLVKAISFINVVKSLLFKD